MAVIRDTDILILTIKMVEAYRSKKHMKALLANPKTIVGANYNSYTKEGMNLALINAIMINHSQYLGCIARNHFSHLTIKPGTQFGFIMNTNKYPQDYTDPIHWVAFYVDTRSGKKPVFEYYNSLGDSPDRKIQCMFKKIKDAVVPDDENDNDFIWTEVAEQSRQSKKCGLFACKFLTCRFNGMSYTAASGSDNGPRDGEINMKFWEEILIPAIAIRNANDKMVDYLSRRNVLN